MGVASHTLDAAGEVGGSDLGLIFSDFLYIVFLNDPKGFCYISVVLLQFARKTYQKQA